MYCYRPECRSLDESMKEAQYFSSLEDLKDYAVRKYDLSYALGEKDHAFYREDVFLKSLSMDEPQTGWKNCGYVIIDGFIQGRYGEKED